MSDASDIKGTKPALANRENRHNFLLARIPTIFGAFRQIQ
jgi:hypothetical protein